MPDVPRCAPSAGPWPALVFALACAVALAHPATALARAPEGGPGCIGEQTEAEPNDSAATASPIIVDAPPAERFVGIYGTITVPGDVDWFRFDAPAGSRVWLSVDTGVAATGTRDTVVTLFAPDGVTVLEEDDDDGTGNGRDQTVESLDASLIADRQLPVAGTYFARVRAKVPGTTVDAYSVLIAFTTAAIFPEVEPNNTMNEAQQMFFGNFLGSLSSAADEDWYSFGVLDNGFPFIVVDGDPERDGVGTNTTLSWSPTMTTDSSGTGSAADPPAEGFAMMFPQFGFIRVTGTGPGTYMLSAWQSGECTVPVELRTLTLE